MNKYPLIKFVVLFICGIVLENFLVIDHLVIICTFAILLISATLIIIFKSNSSVHFVVTYLMVFVLGYSYTLFSNSADTVYPFKKHRYKQVTVKGRITNIQLIKDSRISLDISADSISSDELIYSKPVKLLCNIVEENYPALYELYSKLNVGNSINIKGNIQKGHERRNPGEFDYQNYLEGEGYAGLIYCYNIQNIGFSGSDTDIIKNFIFKVRKNIDEQIRKYNNAESAGLLRGLLLADRSNIDYELKQSFVNAGVIHVLAVSGLHVGFIILIFLFLFNRLNIILRYILTIIGLLLFLVLTGSPPSVFRATIMAVAMILTFLFNRSYNSINSISLAALIILLINPQELFDPGFQLSFSAVLSILIFYPIFQKNIKKLNISSKSVNYILLFGAVSIAAQIGTLPFTLFYFKKLSVISLFANLVVIPVIGFIVGIGIFSLFVSSLWPWLAVIYSAANDILINLLFKFVKWTANFEYSYLSITDFSMFDSIIFYLAILILFYYLGKLSGMKSKIIFFILLLFNFILFTSMDNRELLPGNKLTVTLIDVGQGDCILLKFPNGDTALIDAGNRTFNFDNGERVIIPLLENLNISNIDYAFISHMDSDHYGGYYSLINKRYLNKIYKPEIDSALKKDLHFEAFLKEQNIQVYYYSKTILEFGNCRLYILGNTDYAEFNSLNINDKSGILKLVYGNTSFLFTGDAGIKREESLINAYGSFLKSKILKLGHHGSKTSSGQDFLNYVKPEYGLISAGVENKFHHPSKEVVKRLKENQIKMKRTDIEGAVIVESDGYNIDFADWKNN